MNGTEEAYLQAQHSFINSADTKRIEFAVSNDSENQTSQQQAVVASSENLKDDMVRWRSDKVSPSLYQKLIKNKEMENHRFVEKLANQ